MGKLISFPFHRVKPVTAHVDASVPSKMGTVVLFTGVRYERTTETPRPQLPPSPSAHCGRAGVGTRRRRRSS